MSEQKPEQVPSIGRVVHFVYGDQHYAALITAVHAREIGPDEMLEGQGLVVFPPGDASFTTVAPHDESGAPATWHWPEYVPSRAPDTLLAPAAEAGDGTPRPDRPGSRPKGFA